MAKLIKVNFFIHVLRLLPLKAGFERLTWDEEDQACIVLRVEDFQIGGSRQGYRSRRKQGAKTR